MFVSVDGHNYTHYSLWKIKDAFYRAGLLFIVLKRSYGDLLEFLDIFIYKINDPYKDLMNLDLDDYNYSHHPLLIGSVHPNTVIPEISSMDVQYFKNKVNLAFRTCQEIYVYEF